MRGLLTLQVVGLLLLGCGNEKSQESIRQPIGQFGVTDEERMNLVRSALEQEGIGFDEYEVGQLPLLVWYEESETINELVESLKIDRPPGNRSIRLALASDRNVLHEALTQGGISFQEIERYGEVFIVWSDEDDTAVRKTLSDVLGIEVLYQELLDEGRLEVKETKPSG
jgi:hypothetical protein